MRAFSRSRSPIWRGAAYSVSTSTTAANASLFDALALEGGPRRPRGSGLLAEPRPALEVVEDGDVLAGLEDEVEVAPAHRLRRPPAVEDPPLLAHRRDGHPSDPRRHVFRRLDAGEP